MGSGNEDAPDTDNSHYNQLETDPYHSQFHTTNTPSPSPEAKLDCPAWKMFSETSSSSLTIPTLSRTPTMLIPIPRTDIKTSTWNINGINSVKMVAVCWLFEAMNLDVLVLTDSRQTTSETSAYTQQATLLLPPDTQVRHSPLPTSGKGTWVGGQLVIVSHRWSDSISNFWTDDTHLGLVTALTLK